MNSKQQYATPGPGQAGEEAGKNSGKKTGKKAGQVPEGYRPCARQAGFSALAGPFYECQPEGGPVLRGFQPGVSHCNPEGWLHGGMVSTFADFLMYQALGDLLGEGARTPTINMSVNFIAAARAGSWVSGAARVTERTRSLAFTTAEIHCREQLLATATGVYRLLGH